MYANEAHCIREEQKGKGEEEETLVTAGGVGGKDPLSFAFLFSSGGVNLNKILPAADHRKFVVLENDLALRVRYF